MQNGQNRLCRFWSFWRSARKSALLDRVLIKNQPKSQKSTLPIFDFWLVFDQNSIKQSRFCWLPAEIGRSISPLFPHRRNLRFQPEIWDFSWSNLARIWPAPARSAQIWAASGQLSQSCTPKWLKSPWRFLLILDCNPDIDQNLAKWPDSDQKSGQIRPDSNQIWPDLTRFWSNPARSGQIWLESGHILATSGQIWPALAGASPDHEDLLIFIIHCAVWCTAHASKLLISNFRFLAVFGEKPEIGCRGWGFLKSCASADAQLSRKPQPRQSIFNFG